MVRPLQSDVSCGLALHVHAGTPSANHVSYALGWRCRQPAAANRASRVAMLTCLLCLLGGVAPSPCGNTTCRGRPMPRLPATRRTAPPLLRAGPACPQWQRSAAAAHAGAMLCWCCFRSCGTAFVATTTDKVELPCDGTPRECRHVFFLQRPLRDW